MNTTPPDPGPALTAWVQSMVDAAAEKAAHAAVEKYRALERESTAEPSPYMTRRASAEFLGTCEDQLARLAKSGKVKHYKCGRHLRFKREDLVAYLEGGAK